MNLSKTLINERKLLEQFDSSKSLKITFNRKHR